jgi:hypothetical protein
VKNYEAAVRLDVDALCARAKRPERLAALDGAAESPAGVIRKTTARPVRRVSSVRR